MPQVRGHRRKHSRSMSPVASKHKRSWQNPEGERFGGDGGRLQHRHRSPSPIRGNKKDFRVPARLNDRRNYSATTGGLRKSHSPLMQRRPRPRSPITGRGVSPSYLRHPQMPLIVDREKSGSLSHHIDERSGSRFKQRSHSVRPPQENVADSRNKRDIKDRRSPPSLIPGPSTKKRTHHSSADISSAPKRPRSRSHNRSLGSSSQIKSNVPSALNSGSSIPQRKVSTTNKKKPSRLTLHKRFTIDDQDPFELEDNVTIAIVRKPDAQPSEDVTVKKVFDSSQFKMIHKKTEGRKPIFDREEIKVWRHDENLTDDPDYERRLVRVKSTSTTSKSAVNSLMQTSPDILRKTPAPHAGSSSNRSPHMEPQIRLVPRPDPRYETKFRQQIEREEELGRVKRNEEKKRGVEDKRSSTSSRGVKGDFRDRRVEEDKKGDRVKEETYDLRQALERRRSDREEGTFRIEVRRDSIPEAELFYRNGQQVAVGSGVEPRRFVQEGTGDRNVVLDQDRARRRFAGSVERDSRRGWRGGRFNDDPGHVARGRGRRRDWSQDRGEVDGGGVREEGMMNFRDGGRNFERRPRYSNSPSNTTRGWRGGFGGRGRGRVGDFTPFIHDLDVTEVADVFKYSQHDDRDVSPRSFRGRGRFPSRNYGDNNFRAMGRGGQRGGGRGYRGGYRGRGFGSLGDRRSIDRIRDVSVDREWKHDMYDSLQTEIEEPHSTTVGI
uniref:Btz domain-containing protein n=2 Tax=Arion vulgaris TaxID=1028688 RepID=A0A0B6ZWZ6_9EUPU